MSMIELSYANVNNGIRKGIPITAWCPNKYVAEHVFRRAVELYGDRQNGITYQPQFLSLNFNGINLIFKPWSVKGENFKGYRGIHMIHPELSMNFTYQKDFDVYAEMQHLNERYLDQWRS